MCSRPAKAQSLVAYQRELHQLQQSLRSELNSCEAALQRIEQGTFGLCEICGEPIELNRLKADPLITRCLSCQGRS